MSWNPLDWLKPATALTDSVGDAIDKIVTSDEERLELRNELKSLEANFQIKMEELSAKAETERTARWTADSVSESALARNIRPIALIFLGLVVTILALMDGNVTGFTVQNHWVGVFELAFGTVLGGYFVMRTVDKGVKVWKGKQDG